MITQIPEDAVFIPVLKCAKGRGLRVQRFRLRDGWKHAFRAAKRLWIYAEKIVLNEMLGSRDGVEFSFCRIAHEVYPLPPGVYWNHHISKKFPAKSAA
jgi:hypothetical protein